LASSLVGAVTLSPGAVFAQGATEGAAAQGLFDEAKALMTAGRAREACPKLEESQRLDPGSGTLLNLARCYAESGRVASAWSTYLEAAAAARAAGNSDREQAARELAGALAPRVSKLSVKVAPGARVAGLEIRRDGNVVGAAQWGLAIPADEGAHEIVARAPRRREWKGAVEVKGEGTVAEIEVPELADVAAGTPAQAADEPPAPRAASGLSTQKILALVSGGVGVVGLGAGTVFGLKAMSKKGDADETCTGNVCSSDAGVTAGNDAHSAGNVATIGMVVGAAGAPRARARREGSVVSPVALSTAAPVALGPRAP